MTEEKKNKVTDYQWIFIVFNFLFVPIILLVSLVKEDYDQRNYVSTNSAPLDL